MKWLILYMYLAHLWCYPLDKSLTSGQHFFSSTYPLYGDLSSGQCCPFFEQLGHQDREISKNCKEINNIITSSAVMLNSTGFRLESMNRYKRQTSRNAITTRMKMITTCKVIDKKIWSKTVTEKGVSLNFNSTFVKLDYKQSLSHLVWDFAWPFFSSQFSFLSCVMD